MIKFKNQIILVLNVISHLPGIFAQSATSLTMITKRKRCSIVRVVVSVVLEVVKIFFIVTSVSVASQSYKKIVTNASQAK